MYDTNYEDKYLKLCNHCDEWLPLENFSKNKNSKDGKAFKCKSCQSEYHTKWRTEINREGYNAYMRNYFQQRREEDPVFRVISSLRTRLCNVVKGKQNATNQRFTSRTMEYLGCTEQFFKSWLQYQFDDEMNWNNFGSYWHVDHVLPVSMFNHEDEEAKNICWNWANLRPLEASKNHEKSNKIDFNLYRNQIEKAKSFRKKTLF